MFSDFSLAFLYKFFYLLDKRVTKYDIDQHLRRRHPGYDGSKIVKDLGFVYQYPDPKASIIDSADSMVKFGLADGKAHPLPIITNGALVFAGFAVLFVAWM